MEVWAVYNKTTGRLYLVKGRRLATRISSTANKLYKLVNSSEITICESAVEFFQSHHIDKNKIKFGWDISSLDRMNLLRGLFKSKELYEN